MEKQTEAASNERGPEPLPPPLLSGNPVAWLTLFGPGAIIASLTIGTGELIFSTRGGALFGYRVLFLFVVISILKWALVLGTSRHIVLTGVHPYQRMMHLPGPRGWFPIMLFLTAAVCMPIWVSFHSGVLGNLTSQVTGTQDAMNGGIDYVFGAAILTGVVVLATTGGYEALERVQLAIVTALIGCAIVTLFLYKPDWLEMIKGAVIPPIYVYPEWVRETHPEIASQPVWVETTRYVGVIGGAGYDYLAYTAFLRDKRWGRAAMEPADHDELERMAADRSHPVRLWVRAPLIDCTLSFIVVVAFSAVFVASGAIILGPAHQIPKEENMLELQSQFVTRIHPLLYPLYVAGAFLTMFGTLYGTFEVAHTIFNEIVRCFRPDIVKNHARRLKLINVAWCALGAYLVLGWSLAHQLSGAKEQPRILLAILTPVNLFTGVLGCGLFCFVVVWMERRFLPSGLRMPVALTALNIFAGVAFFFLGVKGYWDVDGRTVAVGGLVGVALLSLIIAAAWPRRTQDDSEDESFA